MDDKRLDEALAHISTRNIPTTPRNFNAAVWALIGRRRPSESWIDVIANALRQPAWALSILAVTLAISVNAGVYGAIRTPVRTHQSLGLEVFSSRAPTLPSTLLSENR